MNPPFANQQGIAHVEHALQFLKPGGILVAITLAGARFCSDPKAPAFRDLADTMDADWYDLPSGLLAEVGTEVSAVILCVTTELCKAYTPVLRRDAPDDEVAPIAVLRGQGNELRSSTPFRTFGHYRSVAPFVGTRK